MGGQRSILKATRDVKPAYAIRMQGEWPCSAKGAGAFAIAQVSGRVGRHLFFVVGVVEAGPLLFLFVPPYKFLAFAPGPAIGTRRSAVVDDPAVVRPGESPAVAQGIFRAALIGKVSVFIWKDSAIDPCATRCGAIAFEVFYVGELLALRQIVSIDFL